MKEIKITRDQIALVDDEDYEYLNQWDWLATRCQQQYSFYATRWRGISEERRRIFMHRVLMNPGEDMVIDHIDGNGLNNQKANLRVCTVSQNAGNQGPMTTNTSGFKGVCMRKGRYAATLCSQHLGTYDLPEEAARAYDVAARNYYGEFAQTNFSIDRGVPST